MLRAQRLLPRIPARLQRLMIRLCGSKRFVDWSFGHYLRIAPPGLLARRAPDAAAAQPPLAGRAGPRQGRVGRRTSPAPSRFRDIGVPSVDAETGDKARRASESPLDGRRDVLICGASFAGLAAARELAGSGADVLVIDRYEIGERATSACGIPTDWLRALGLIELELQRFGELVVHTPGGTTVLDLPYTFSTFDYDEMCELLWRECDAELRDGDGARPPRREATAAELAVETDRGPVSAPLVVDALGWRRILATDDGFQPLDAPLTRALEVHPRGASEDLEVWVDRRYARAGYGWSFPAGEELRIGVCSYDPRPHVREGTDLLAADLGHERVRYQGNWIPHELRPPTEGGVFFAGDSAGPVPAADRGGNQDRALLRNRRRPRAARGRRGPPSREQALAAYARLHDSHRRGFRLLLFFQRLIPRIPPRLLAPLFRIYKTQRLIDLTFNAYLRLAPPDFAGAAQRTIRTVPASSSATPSRRSALSGTWSRPNRPRRSITTEAVSWPVTVAAATPPAPIAETAISALVT